MKHTPGPWQVGHFDSNMICDSDGANRGCAPIARVEGTAAERRANARLIACAPELLEALKLAVRQNEHDMLMTGKELRNARAAIAKAEGA
jgi:hypothetical protein